MCLDIKKISCSSTIHQSNRSQTSCPLCVHLLLQEGLGTRRVHGHTAQCRNHPQAPHSDAAAEALAPVRAMLLK